MHISQLAQSIPPSATLKLNDTANALRARGEPVIHLGGGEPKNPAPPAAIQRSEEVLATRNIKYVPTSGTPALKKAIIGYTEENYGRLVKPENVLVSTGAKQALYNLLLAILDPGDEVILLAPYWVSYPEMVRLAHANPVVVSPEEGTFMPRLEAVEAALTPSTRGILVNSPNNPSGLVYPEDFIAGLVGLCERRGITLIMDDIYHRLVFDGKRAPSPYQFTGKDIENTQVVTINGVSKLYGMTGFRIGWAVGPRALIGAMGNIQAQTTSCAATLSQAAAEAALTGDQGVVEEVRQSIEANRTVMLTELQTVRDLRVIPPDGTFYCLPDFRAYSDNSVELAQFLLEKALVVTVPGAPFGMEGHLRLSYCGSAADVVEGVKRIRWALDPAAEAEITIGDRQVVRDWA